MADWRELEDLRARAKSEIEKAASPAEIERCRIGYLGRSGELTARLRAIAALPAGERKEAGERLNGVKVELERTLAQRAAELEGGARVREGMDVTFPGRVPLRGHLHPISAALSEILEIFRGLGFERADGPEAETERYNFIILNTPADHPARDTQATYYLGNGALLRTQTSAIWGHVMEKRPPPLRIVCPGRCFRRDAVDASHSPVFHQIEGLWVDDRCRFSDLKGILEAFLISYFGDGTRVRFDPDYFPFTEPSAQVSIECTSCAGNGCRTCGRSGWLELLGAGMVNPAVFEQVGGPYLQRGLRGFAFGLGLDRFAMMKYRITDMRWLFENDLRLFAQIRG